MTTGARNGTAVQQAVDHVREKIKQGEWGPGHRLVESDLTVGLGISRGPLREALGRLASEGLVTIEPYRGAMVRRTSREDLESLYQVREVLEGLAARLAAERMADKECRGRMTEQLRIMRGVENTRNYRSYMDANTRFHQTIIEIGANAIAMETLGRFSTQVYRYSMRNLFDEASRIRSCKEHIAVAEAIVLGDGAKAERLMRKHVHRSGEQVLDLLSDTP